MDVDIPPNEEAMETDPPLSTNNTNTDTDNMIPQLTRKDSVLDTDGDEVMQEGEGEEEGEEGMYEDIEIGDAAAEEGVGEGIEAENIEYDEEGEYDEDVPIEESENVDEDEHIAEGEIGVQGEGVEGAEVEGVEAVSTVPTDISKTHDTATADNEVVAAEESIAGLHEPTAPPSISSPSPQTPHGNGQITDIPAPVQSSKTIPTTVEPTENKTGQEESDHPDRNEPEAEGEEEEGEEGEEEYDLLTPSTLPPIILNLPNSRRALFNPFTTDEGTALPSWFAERMEELCEGTLAQMWAAIRSSLVEEGDENEEEMVVIEKLMDLKMGDVSFCPSSSRAILFSTRFGKEYNEY
jgi:hypothetical protein